MNYRIEHVTKYTYSQPAVLSCNDVCLDLRATDRQRTRTSTWSIEPEPSRIRDHSDFFGNRWRTLAFEQPLQSLELAVRHEVEVSDYDPPQSAFQARPLPADRLYPYRWTSPLVETGPEFAEYAGPSFTEGRPLCDCVMDLTRRIFADFSYAPDTTTIGTATRELLRNRRGVCQDYAHFALAVLRSIGIAARYVSGYLNTIPKEGQDKVYGADASHAWISVHDRERGWVDFDPTNGLAVRNGHVTIGWGRDYGDVTPLRGVILGGGKQTLAVVVDVRSL